jgi:hypothetical protein
MTEPELLEQLEAVQKGLHRAGREMVLSSSQALLRGILVLVGCGASYALLERSWEYLAGLWGAVVVLMMASEALLYWRLASRTPDKFVTGVERQMLRFILLAGAIAAALTAALVWRGEGALVPGTWLLLVGSAYVAVGLFSFSRTWVLGLFACAAGAAALFLEPVYSLAVAAAALGLGSIVWAVVLRFVERNVE